ncbi:MAG: phosphotyrosine protein phosphatase [Thermoproteota archaeon]
MNVLFVCTGNMDRSPTAADLLTGKEGFQVESAGTWIHARRRVSQEVLNWADQIFAMEERHKDLILNVDPSIKDKIVVLDIPDNYHKKDPELVRILKSKLSEHLDITWP